MMKIEVIPAAKLSAEHIAAWSRLQLADANLANPFFRPEFALAVAAERDDVEVAVWEQGGELVGFLPFERTGKRVGRAVGYYMNLQQGAITRQGLEWSPADVVRAAKLRGFQFDHIPASQQVFAPYQYSSDKSHFLDLSQGFEHYRKSRGKSASVFISHVLQKDRKAGRDLGEVRLELQPTSHDTLTQLLNWKIQQCRAMQVRCVFELDWMVRLHHRLLDIQTEDFAGDLFALYMGDRLAASFFTFRSHQVHQGSVLGYDRELSAYAPGLVGLVRVAQFCEGQGVTRIELGSGEDHYKEKMGSGTDLVTEGAVHGTPLMAPLYRGWVRAKDRLRTTRLRGPVRRMRRWMLSTRIKLGYTD